MKFRLTYEGEIKSNGSPQHKHQIRKKFHPQLQALWEQHPYLKKAKYLVEERPNFWVAKSQLREHLANTNARFGFTFIPLVIEELSLLCGLDILFLRPGIPGTLIKSGDLDGRMKTIFDALRMPDNPAELGGHTPSGGETPFYCLLQDDKLISTVSINTDTLLEPTGASTRADIDARLVITVDIKPFDQAWHNINFGAG